MFTGIVQARGRVSALDRKDGGLRLSVEAGAFAAPVALGESIAVDGVCLTVAGRSSGGFDFDAGAETLGLTTLGGKRIGDAVNLERALRAGDPLGGHFVSGHVDGVGRIGAMEPGAGQTWMRVALQPAQLRQTILKGSIAIDGVSLTIASIDGDEIGIALIPHTLQETTLGSRRAGDPVNVETDLLGKWILQRLDPWLERFSGNERIDPK